MLSLHACVQFVNFKYINGYIPPLKTKGLNTTNLYVSTCSTHNVYKLSNKMLKVWDIK